MIQAVNWFQRYKYDKENEKTSEMRNTVLIVAALIAAVTFQAGVNPPGGVWQDSNNGHVAGRAIYASHKVPFYVFLISNTMALSASIMTIINLTYRFPFSVEIWMATLSMIVTYGSSVFAITPENVRLRYILFMAGAPIVARVGVEIGRWGLKQWKRSNRGGLPTRCDEGQDATK